MINTPLVSIIIPAFNSEEYINECLQSALNQTWNNKEIIVINDGSTDGTLSIVNKYQKYGVKLIEQKNQGSSSARNNGIRNANGEYFQFLDSDDFISPNKIEIQVKALNESSKLAVCRTIHFNDNSDPLLETHLNDEDNFLYSTNDPLEYLINLWGGNENGASMIQTNAWLVPRNIIDSNELWQEFYSPDDDGEYFSRLILASEGIVFTPDCYNYYRGFSSYKSLSSRKTYTALLGCYKSILLKKETLISKTDDYRAKYAIARQLIDLAVLAYPQHKKLTFEIISDVEKLGKFNFKHKIGGTIINTICNIFGWKVARILSYYKNISLKNFHVK